MKILLLENNLMWSVRLKQSLISLGHEPVVALTIDATQKFDAAIVNLGVAELRDKIVDLVEAGVPVIGHAGHKEKELHALGKGLGCTILATNSQITHKLDNLLEELPKTKSGRPF